MGLDCIGRTLAYNGAVFKLNAVWPNWNWKEIAALAEKIQPEIKDLFVDRIIVPARPEFPAGYLKGEWVIRLTGRNAEKSLLLSVRARHPYLALFKTKGPQAATLATRSPFDLSLSKHLKGLRLISCRALPRERCVIFDFEGELRLVLMMISATPEALLVKKTDAPVWSVIARSRTLRTNPEETGSFTPPDGARAPADMAVRPWVSDLGESLSEIEAYLSKEAYSLRLQEIEKRIRELAKVAKDRIRQSAVSKKEAENEANWQRYGDLLKANMGMLLRAENSIPEREVLDFETGEKIIIPCDPKLDLSRQVEKFYQLAQRKSRRLSEAENRIQTFSEALNRLNLNQDEYSTLLQEFEKNETPKWKPLEALERSLRGGAQAPTPSATGKSKRKAYSWLGKAFTSKEGWAIWVGRSKDENLELTFKHARGNDLWMHIRGRPGAHLVIPVQPGKSVPLETLLDAANLAIHYSGGQNLGKTEVDYTFKKYVKRIKDSSEASYTNNKTLIVAPDPVRLKRLLG
jgi:predicted ribosome quality control (RQC) complex YloA/Tae2 family protein